MKSTRALFQTTVLLVILVVFSHSLRADTRNTLLQTDSPFVQSDPVDKSSPEHRSASVILAGLKTGLMGDVVPLVALFLFGRAVWMLIPSRRMEAALSPVHRLASRMLAGIQSRFMEGKAFLAAPVVSGRAIWRWIMAPRTQPEDVEEEPGVDVPPLRTTPGRATRF